MRFRTDDGRTFADAGDAWEHELELARAAVIDAVRDHVQAGPHDALSVATALLEAPTTFERVLARYRCAVARVGRPGELGGVSWEDDS